MERLTLDRFNEISPADFVINGVTVEQRELNAGYSILSDVILLKEDTSTEIIELLLARLAFYSKDSGFLGSTTVEPQVKKEKLSIMETEFFELDKSIKSSMLDRFDMHTRKLIEKNEFVEHVAKVNRIIKFNRF